MTTCECDFKYPKLFLKRFVVSSAAKRSGKVVVGSSGITASIMALASCTRSFSDPCLKATKSSKRPWSSFDW